MGMTDVLNATWSMETPYPVVYMDYLDLLQQTRHQLEDTTNLCTQVQRQIHPSKLTKSDDRYP